MPEKKPCPPEETFDVVTPGQCIDEIKSNDVQIQIANADISRDHSAHLRGYTPDGSLIFDPGWDEFYQSWRKWFFTWEAFRDAHDEWLENIDGASVSRQNELYKCELIDWLDRFKKLGGKHTGPNPKFTEHSKGIGDTAESLVKLAAIALGGYLIVKLIPSKK